MVSYLGCCFSGGIMRGAEGTSIVVAWLVAGVRMRGMCRKGREKAVFVWYACGN
jgi:hypothetical protein